MLSELVVEGLGVIDRAELQLTSGSSALTGETGAGKTLLVAALGLLAGARADRGLVRQGATEARVEARFLIAPEHPVVGSLDEQGLRTDPAPEGEEVILSRSISAEGRSKARVNGHLVPMSMLQEIGASLIEVAGQHEHLELARGNVQRELLDTFAGPRAQELAASVAARVEELAELERELLSAREAERDRERELEVLRFEVKEITAVEPRPGESEELRVEAARMEHAGTIAEGVREALALLRGEGGVGEHLPAALAALAGAAEKDERLLVLKDRLATATLEIEDIADELVRHPVSADPVALAERRERLSQLDRLRRRFGATDNDVLDYMQRASTRIQALEAASSTQEDLGERIESLKTEATGMSQELSQLRSEAAGELARAVETLLAELALANATFEVKLVPSALYAGGLETIEFLVAANDGEVARPLGKVASGGELSRIALALRLLTSTGPATTLVFDEVDAGVGGTAARSVGRCLAELGRQQDVQVLVVTHLPQVAAATERQYLVSKSKAGARTTSSVVEIKGDDRVQELSRMLAGLPESERAKEHAQELLELSSSEASK